MIQRKSSVIDWATRFVLHVVTGALSVIVHYAVMAVLLGLGASPIMATSIGFIAGAITRFLTAYFKVFNPAGTMRAVMPRFLLALGTQFFLNSLFLSALIEVGLIVWWAQFITTILLTFGNYLVYRLWVFR